MRWVCAVVGLIGIGLLIVVKSQPLAPVVVVQPFTETEASVACPAPTFLTGGGGFCGSGALRVSRPAMTDPPGGDSFSVTDRWQAVCDSPGDNHVYAVCDQR